MEVHHIYPRRFGGSDDPSNLITLCDLCHDGVPSNPDDFLNYQRQGGQHWRTLRYQMEEDLQSVKAELVPQFRKSLEESMLELRQKRFGFSLVEMHEHLLRLGLDLDDEENIRKGMAGELPLPDPDIEVCYKKPAFHLKPINSKFEQRVLNTSVVLNWLVIGYESSLHGNQVVWREKKKVIGYRIEDTFGQLELFPLDNYCRQ